MAVQNLRFQDVLTSCEEMESIIAKSFGPIGSFTMILKNDGHVSISTDGLDILQKANFRNPIKQFIINAISNHHKLLGDQTKQFLLILTEFLRLFKKLKEGKKFANKIHISHGILKIIVTILPKVFENIQTSISNVYDVTNCSVTVARLIEGFMNGKFPKNVNHVLCHRIHSFIMQSANQLINLPLVIQNLQFNFNLFCFHTGGSSINNSYLGAGFLIHGNLHSDQNEFSGKFLLMKNQNCIEFKDIKMHLERKTDLEFNLQWSEIKLLDILQFYNSIGICFIISAEKVSSSTIFFCKKNNIAVVDEVDDEEIETITEFSGIYPIQSFHKNIENSFIGCAKQVKLTQIGNNQFLQLDIDHKNKYMNLRHLVICAPTEDMGKQYKQTIANCLKSLQFNLHSFPQLPFNVHFGSLENGSSKNKILNSTDYIISEKNMCSQLFNHYLNNIPISECEQLSLNSTVLAVGGACEILISYKLQEYCNQHKIDGDLRLLMECLGRAVLVIPRQLYENSYRNHNAKFIAVSQDLFDRLPKNLSAIDGVTGNIVNVEDVFGWESIPSKYHLLENILTLIMQLLKVDSVLYVKQNNTTKESD